jgi:hypothetical protein
VEADPNVESLLNQLRKEWRFNDLGIALGIVKWGLAHPDSIVQAVARESLNQAVQRIAKPREAAGAMTPILARGLLDADVDIRRQAVIGLQVVAKQNGDLGPALLALGDNLVEGGEVAEGAARALWLGGLGKTDLGKVRDRLEEALSSEQINVRAYTSKALSRYLWQAGIEAKLEARYSEAWIVDGGWSYIDGPVAVEVSHRRTYAATDKEIAGAKLAHMCGVCGSKETQSIYYEIDAGTSWKMEKYEVLCEGCKKYTVYEYDW